MLDTTLTFPNAGINVLIISGTHGDESNAVKVSSMLYRSLAALATSGQQAIDRIGSIRFLIGINEQGLKYNSREYVPSQYSHDINRSFSAEPQTQAEIINVVTDAIKDCDVMVDLHNSEFCANCFAIDNNSEAPYFIEFLTRNKLPFTLRDSCGNSTIKQYANKAGKVGFTLELDCMGYSYDAQKIQENMQFVYNFLKTLGSARLPKSFDDSVCTVWNPTALSAKEIPVIDLHAYTAFSIFSRASGLVNYAKPNPLATYQKGETIAEVTDFAGNILYTIKAPVAGFMTCISSSLYIAENDSIGEFQPSF